ncbi:cAMP-binding domain of CRP or a regulatory subunit of cAMP-dependent protein kinases [Clostridium cavendishii DSM 21758]|uniref:cAMP-binding domain of CRP or a regulatory subunit of cAMP-dependent protein kinases n=1 Tax=Clostridium cavendishii DSM 21758 TaxID=1121302 RepID=A0A1M6I0Y9_9CLOT|nr:transcriptional regulator YeiL [Clostridium cavendishii]SHJ27924.1 cAMP-binding domain of CRP or a regulatory subunit of cAMP-dependent protein kinases [Clostridium cavendishii DSM 21758]
MKKLLNKSLIKKYIEEYGIEKYFSEDINKYIELIVFNKGEHICREGEVVEYILFLVKGKAKVYSTLKNGKSLLLCFYDCGKIVGDVEFIKSEGANCNMQAIEETSCLGIPMNKVKEVLLDDSKFLRFMCDSLSNKLNRLSKNSSINLLYPLENRIASYILATASKSGNGKIIFEGNLTEISELLGASYRHLLRTLKVLCDDGFIIKKDNCYEVLDYDSLKELASDLYK